MRIKGLTKQHMIGIITVFFLIMLPILAGAGEVKMGQAYTAEELVKVREW